MKEMIVETWKYVSCCMNYFKYTEVYYTNGDVTVDRDFREVKKIKGKVIEEREIGAEEILKMIDEYAWAADAWSVEKEIEAKNTRIHNFLGI